MATFNPNRFDVIDSKQYPVIDLFDNRGRLKLMSQAEYEHYDPMSIRLWCHRHGRYGLPTVELVEWLKSEIRGTCIEIGAGAGDLARFLHIRATDNRMQEMPEVRLMYVVGGQPTVPYGANVEKLDALDAVKKYKPDTVIGSWITQHVESEDFERLKTEGGNPWAVHEDKILETGCKYILIGNEKVHGHKRIMRAPHETYILPFNISRAMQPEFNRVYVWDREP